MLEGITKAIAKVPGEYDLIEDPTGGESYCTNQEFTVKLAERWLEVLSKPGIAGAGLDKDDFTILRDSLKGWFKKLEVTGLEAADADDLMVRLEELIQEAPEADDDDEEDSDED
eukprot:gene4231-4480_t